MFVSWCAYQAGILNSVVPRYAYCPSGVEWYRERKKYYSRSGGYTPKIGDTVFFWNTSAGVVGHTGIVTNVTSSTITTIEGNSSDGVYSRTYNKTNTYIHGYGNNGGTEIGQETKPTTGEINSAILKKGVSLLRSCNVTVNYNSSTQSYVVPSIPKDVTFELNKECKFTIIPNVTFTAKVSSTTHMYEDADAMATFNIVNGKPTSESIDIAGVIANITSGLDKDAQEYVNIIDSLSVSVDTGAGKVTWSVSKNKLEVSYTLKTDVYVTDNYSQSFSYSYKITIEIPDDTGGLWDSVYETLTDFIDVIVDEKETIIVFVIIAVIAVSIISGGGLASIFSALSKVAWSLI